jgi:hypothetical protein
MTRLRGPHLLHVLSCGSEVCLSFHRSLNVMLPGEALEPKSRKRKRTTEHAPAADSQPQSQAKRRKRSRRSPHRTPPEFWDNLSRVPLCRRALREFDRRTVRPVTPKLPVPSVVKGDLKRFARHGGPDLRDIRGVSPVYAIENHANSFLSTQSRKHMPE